MSYILDALKKSERERSLSHVPTLSTVHSYPKSPARQRWVWLALALLIILMLIGAGIYGVMFWGQEDLFRSAGEKTHTTSVGADRIVTPQEPVSTAVAKPALKKAASPRAEVSAPEPVTPPAPRPAEIANTSTSYPTIDDLEDAVRRQLSDLVVNVVSYSEQPSRRFVMINQKIYRQGQTVKGQLTVVEIKPEGAILRFQGREFLAVP